MPDPVSGAIIGAAGIGAVSSSSAAKSASKSSAAAVKSADAAAQLQYEVSMEQLAFQKEQLGKWEDIFGPIQQNLSNYYQNLSPDTLASSGLQNIEQSYAQSRRNLDTALAKRGLSDSGATVSGLTQLETSRMLGKAEVQTNAPIMAAQQKQNFLAGGASQQSTAQSGIGSAFTNQMNMFGQQALNKQNMANTYSNQAAQAYSGIGSSVGSGINTYMNYQSNQALQNALTRPQVINTKTGGMGVYGLDYTGGY